MMTEQAKVPAIRFAGFTDPWEQRKLGEIVSIGAGAPPSAFSAGNFLYVKVDDLNESSHFQFDSAQRVDANTAVKPIRKGSIIFAKRGAAILGNKVRVLGKTAYIDTNMMALEPRGVDADFLWLFINQTGLYRIADTSTIPQINNKHIEPYPVDIPNMAEQQAIGTFFSRLDDLITLHQRKYDKLVIFKKSMLEKMFPKDGESVPEIRFAGFTDPWEQRKFGDCFEFLKSNTLSRAGLNGENGTARNVHYGDILIKFGDCLDGERSDLPFITDDTVLPKYAGSILREGDVIFADTAEDETAGKCVELRKLPKEPTISGLHTIPARPRFPFGTGYLGHYLNSDAYHRQLLPLMQGIKVISVSKAALQDTQVRFPGLSEQSAIGAALNEIDSLITLHQRKLELLQDIKKSLLDKMFV
ncbi:restriction endonuclease subunit S [Bifidobacterium longum]|jgi:type I restriction enzyme S subunit|nr:restriction endonuclease subunit S [Bifidobacterium longum]